MLKVEWGKKIFPSAPVLVTYMKDTRRAESESMTADIIEFMLRIHSQWMATYLADKVNGELALEHMVQRMAKRYAFSSQKPQAVKTTYEELEETRATFSLDFCKTYAACARGGILNVDETAVHFDVPPIKSWAGRGRKDSAHILGNIKYAGRMAAVLTVREV
ncbi:Hypothetical protein PHPALM_8585 [Phytophthora palmivora]|uniref:Uncharacterized protein n=1 Tax=Phytophthora palmivora TaxID=4796 RepID=A0A2P4Y9H4_9STRA|nr:Hypothetical protein PHPALM_8585 [Phytophthora palmivora]